MNKAEQINPNSFSKEQQELSEKLLLAKNIVQYFYAKLEYENMHPKEDTFPEADQEQMLKKNGASFEQWYTSEEGMKTLDQYVREHSTEEIFQEKGMSEIVRSFLMHKNQSHSL